MLFLSLYFLRKSSSMRHILKETVLKTSPFHGCRYV